MNNDNWNFLIGPRVVGTGESRRDVKGFNYQKIYLILKIILFNNNSQKNKNKNVDCLCGLNKNKYINIAVYLFM